MLLKGIYKGTIKGSEMSIFSNIFKTIKESETVILKNISKRISEVLKRGFLRILLKVWKGDFKNVFEGLLKVVSDF